MNIDVLKLMLITHRRETPLSEYLSFIKQCVTSGVTCVQLREKNATTEFLLEFAKELKSLLSPLKIPFIINDHIDIARYVEADGIHLGQSDLSPDIARQLLGPEKIIGLSIETENEMVLANQQPVNYVAASAVFPSHNKTNLKTLWGLEGLSELVQLSKHPVIGIGGIDQHNLDQVMQTGAKGVALIGALHDAANPSEKAWSMKTIIDEGMNNYNSTH